jgi:hypothetical protein
MRLPRWAAPLADPTWHLVLIGYLAAKLAAFFDAIREP